MSTTDDRQPTATDGGGPAAPPAHPPEPQGPPTTDDRTDDRAERPVMPYWVAPDDVGEQD